VALGLQYQPIYATARCDFRPNDILFLYTDGLIECMNPHMEEFGEEQMLCLLLANRRRELADIRDHILQHLQKFACGDCMNDDITFMIIKHKDGMQSEKK